MVCCAAPSTTPGVLTWSCTTVIQRDAKFLPPLYYSPQYYFPLRDGADGGLRVTVSKYRTPSGYDISTTGRGLEPDSVCGDHPRGSWAGGCACEHMQQCSCWYSINAEQAEYRYEGQLRHNVCAGWNGRGSGVDGDFRGPGDGGQGLEACVSACGGGNAPRGCGVWGVGCRG